MGISWLSWFTDPYRTARLYCLGFVWCPQEWMAKFKTNFPWNVHHWGETSYCQTQYESCSETLFSFSHLQETPNLGGKYDPRWVTRPFPEWLKMFKHAHSPGVAWRDFFSISGNNFVGHFTIVSTVKPMHWHNLNVGLSEHWILIISASK